MRYLMRVIPLVALLALGCGGKEANTGGDDPTPTPTVTCGDGQLGAGEACDDGNTTTD